MNICKRTVRSTALCCVVQHICTAARTTVGKTQPEFHPGIVALLREELIPVQSNHIGALLRSFATDSKGPPKDRLRAVPFVVTQEQADEAYKHYHSWNPLLAPLSNYEKVKQVFLPFWMLSVNATVQLHSAQVGFKRLHQVYNPQTRRHEPRWETEWHYVQLGRTWQALHEAEDPGMQIYASYKYPRPDIQALRPGSRLLGSQALTAEMMATQPPGSTRRVAPFVMPPDAARTFALSYIKGAERNSAEELLKQAYKADAVQLLDLDISVQRFTAYPVYVPAFVFSRRIHGTKIHTFVSGIDPNLVSGTRIFDDTKAAAIAAVGTSLLLLAFGVHWSWMQLFWLGAVLPGVVAAAAARFTPQLRRELHQWLSQAQQARAQQATEGGASASWEAEWVRQYMGREEQRRRFEEQSEEYESSSWSRSYQHAGSSASARDPLGFYQALDLEQDASTAEVQAAFRAAALKHHPDRYIGSADKAKATARFQKISQAYAVLRDPKKRAQYDLGQYRA